MSEGDGSGQGEEANGRHQGPPSRPAGTELEKQVEEIAQELLKPVPPPEEEPSEAGAPVEMPQDFPVEEMVVDTELPTARTVPRPPPETTEEKETGPGGAAPGAPDLARPEAGLPPAEANEAEPPAGAPPERSRQKPRKRTSMSNREVPSPAGSLSARKVRKGALRHRAGLVNASGTVNGNGLEGLRNRRGMVNASGAQEGRGNGLVNGGRGIAGRMAVVNGSLVDAEGAINGRGMVNGRGIVNGESITNGRRLAVAEAPPPRRRPTWRLVALAVAAALLVSVAGYYILLSAEKGVRIDGVFGDWQGVRRHSDDIADQSNPSINIRETALVLEAPHLSFYVRTEGKVLEGRNGGVDSLYIFMDTDRDPSTGYPLAGLGAEHVLSVDGYDGSVTSAGLYRFGSGRPRDDWNSRSPAGSARAACSGSELEAQVPLADIGLGGGGKLNALAVLKDSSGGEDRGVTMGSEKVSLGVRWTRVGPASAMPGDAQVALLRLELTAAGGCATVSSVRLNLNEGTSDADISRLALFSGSGYELPGASASPSAGGAELRFATPLEVHSGTTAVAVAHAWISPSATPGRAVGLSMEGASDLSASTKAVSVESRDGELTYIGPPPSLVRVDGAFSDWEGRPEHADPAGDVPTPSIDIRGFRAANDTSDLYFYFRVEGAMMGGSWIPESKIRPSGPSGPSGPPAPLPTVVGEDALMVFIDSDRDAATGYAGGALQLGADHLVSITGREGQVLQRALLAFTGGSDTGRWSWSSGAEIPAATDLHRLECSLPAAAVGSPQAVRLFYYMTDWGHDRDSGDVVDFDLGAGGGRSLETPGGTSTSEAGGEGTRPDAGPLHAPEFSRLALPLAGTAVLFFAFRRARRGTERN